MKKNKIFYMVISVIAAFFLWFYVVTVVNPVSSAVISDIPIVFSGEEVLREDQNLIVANGEGLAVSVHFSGKNTELKKLLQARDEITAVVDVTKLRSAKEYTLSYELKLPSNVSESQISMTDRKPVNVTIAVERLITRQIEIKGDFSRLKVADGYMLEGTTFDYDTVTVEGPEAVVSQIASAQVSPERSDLTHSFTENVEYTLVDSEGKPVDTENLTTDIDIVQLSVSVVLYKEVPLGIELIDGGGATAGDVSYEISPTSVTLSGDAAILDSLNKIVLGNVDLAATPNTKELTMPILLPDGVKCVSGEEEATVKVRVKNRETAVVRATNIAFINTPDTLDVTSMTQLLQVTVRAGSADIEKITTNNLRVVADMSEVTAVGKVTVPVTIAVDGYPDAGVVGDYSIVVSVTEKDSQ